MFFKKYQQQIKTLQDQLEQEQFQHQRLVSELELNKYAVNPPINHEQVLQLTSLVITK